MKPFLKKVLFFYGLFAALVFSALLASTKIVAAYFPYRLDDGTTTLILGDSHPQCGINDALLPHSINLAAGSDTYFYSYVKLKKFLQANRQIDTVILGYSYHNLADGQDKWLDDAATNGHKLPLYFFLFDRDDIVNFSRINAGQLIKTVPAIIRENLSHLYKIVEKRPATDFPIGAYRSVNHRISEKERIEASGNFDTVKVRRGTVDIVYLGKIHDLCSEKNVKLILVGAPVFHNMRKNPQYRREYARYAKKRLTTARVLNFVEVPFPAEFYADSGHLNAKGAAKFTSMLREAIAP